MKPLLLKQALANVNGTAFISLDVETRPRLVGGIGNPMQGAVTKLVTGMQVMVFSNPAYERIVNRRLVAEGFKTIFVVGPRPWGTREEGTPFVEHEGRTYLEVIVLRPGNTEYRFKGMPIDEALIDGLPAERPNDYNVVIRCFQSDSIKRVVVNGRTYS